MSNHFADAHRAFAASFTDRVHGVTDWDAPAPVAGWTARSVVEHLIEWFPGMLAAGSDIVLPAGPDPQADLLAAWEHQRDAVQAVLEDPATASKTYSNPMTGDMPLPVMIQNFYTADVFMHTWDLAKAADIEIHLSGSYATGLREGLAAMGENLRASGHFGPAVETDSEDPVDQLVAFIGRDPQWSAQSLASATS